jgi:DNA (cytosine-5)-methyltransferase 1
MNKINIFSFFSGAGFLDLGFELTGHYVINYVNEIHKEFDDIYKYSRNKMGIPEPKYGHHVEDITLLLDKKNKEYKERFIVLKEQIEESKIETITGIIGGPPCPDFSVAGKNRGKNGDNGKLSGVYCDIICKTKPDFFLFENVKGLYRTAKHRTFFEQLKRKFKKNGYVMTEQLINAIEFGTPQDRERIILIGVKKAVADKLSIKYKKNQLEGFNWDAHKLYSKDQISNCSWPTTNIYAQDVPMNIPDNIIIELTAQYWWTKNDVENHPNSRMSFNPKAGLAKFRTIAEGDDKKICYKRLHRWRYSPTAAYGNNEVHIHPYKPRRISVSEALAIQSLPKEFCIPSDVSLTDAFKSIGNGVPFLAAKGIANTIFDFLNSGEDDN